MTAGAGASLPLLLSWALAVYGFVLIVTGSKVCEPLRRLGKRLHPTLGYFLGCPMCMGFWTGAAASLAGLPLFIRCDGVGAGAAAATLLANGCAGSAICWVLHVVLAKLGAEEL